jgi:hypothetical protein
MNDQLTLHDFADKSYYKTLALDTEFGSKLQMVTTTYQLDATCSDIDIATTFEATIDDDIVFRTSNLKEAISSYNNIIENAKATV